MSEVLPSLIGLVVYISCFRLLKRRFHYFKHIDLSSHMGSKNATTSNVCYNEKMGNDVKGAS